MSQKLVPYERYKDSGVEWLGQIPECWGKKRLRFLFEIKKRIAGSEDFDVLSITQRGIKVKDLENNDGQISMDYTKYQFVEIGDFAMNHMDLLTGWIDISPHFGVTSPDYRVFSMQGALEAFPRYFLYLLQMGYKEKIFYSYGQGSSQLGRWRLPTEQFQDITFPFPSPADQQAISTYLDKQTSRIDALVKEQEELILLLKEKRQALISHTVTKGLDPNAKLKPSGVEWLGDIPERWRTTKLKHLSEEIFDCPHETPAYDPDGEYLVVRTADVFRGTLEMSSAYRLSRAEYENRTRRSKLQPKDIVYGREGERWGFAAIVPEEPVMCLGQRMMQIRVSGSFSPEFVMWQLNSNFVYCQGDVETVGATSPHVNVETVTNFSLTCPPLSEQRAIASFLKKQTENIDRLIAEAESTIALMQEHRSTLISAVVTGKVRVPV